MRFDGSYPEKSLVIAIDEALKRVSLFKTKNPKLLNTLSEITKKLSENKNELLAIEEKFQGKISSEFLISLEEKRIQTVQRSDQFIKGVNAFQAIFDPLARHMPSGVATHSREGMINEFIANISAAQDGGESQAQVVALLMVDHLPIIASALESLPARDRHNPEQRRICVENTLQEITRHLREIGTPEVVAMWENQTSAFEACKTSLEQLHTLSLSLNSLHETAADAWEAFDALTIQNTPELKKLHQKIKALRKVILSTVDTLYDLQKSVKLPTNDYGLVNLLDAIESGQMTLLDTFNKAQKAFYKMMLAADTLELASEEAASSDDDTDETSDSDSSASTTASVSHASFFLTPLLIQENALLIIQSIQTTKI